MIEAIVGFICNHWLLLALVGGACTSAGAAGASANAAGKRTQAYLDKIEEERQQRKKGGKES
jgi:hypothetical protein